MSIGTRVSTGVGGAGNIGSPQLRPTDKTANDYTTPIIKSSHYPTGRGGSGNMARNDNPTEARKAQDVEPLVISSSQQPAKMSSGRGGAGNMVRDKNANGETDARGRQKPVRQGSGVFGSVMEKIRSHSGNGSARRRGSEAGSVKSNMSSSSGSVSRGS